jgi:methylamine utilization protein MauE
VNGFESALSLFAKVLHLVTAPTGYGIAVWVLAIIFVWSGVAKLRQPTLAAKAIMDFGVLRRVRPRLGSALGAAELLLALLLITGTLPAVFLPVTAGLLWFFVLLIARSLRTGKDFACFCFGDADSTLSRLTLVRTTALALLASVLAVAPPPTGMYAGFSETYVLQAVSAAALVAAIVLGGQIPKLLRWNKDPYRIGNTEVNE